MWAQQVMAEGDKSSPVCCLHRRTRQNTQHDTILGFREFLPEGPGKNVQSKRFVDFLFAVSTGSLAGLSGTADVPGSSPGRASCNAPQPDTCQTNNMRQDETGATTLNSHSRVQNEAAILLSSTERGPQRKT
jgi:hypothetical protein